MNKKRVKSLKEISREDEDIQMIENSNNWPGWPLLPVKRYGKDDFLECGFIYADGFFTVYAGNIFAIKSGDDITKLPQHEYVSATDVVLDGWMVD